MTKTIYKASSNFQFFKSVIWKFLCLTAIGYLYFQYAENPTLIIILSLIILLFFFVIGNDEIIITRDEIIQKDTSLAYLLFKSKGISYKLSELKSATLPKKPDSTIEEITTAVFINAALPKSRIRNNNMEYPINLEFKDGRTIQILTSLGVNQRNRIVEVVNSLLL